MQRTIVLNGDYTFINTISWKKAVTLVIKEKVEVLKYADKVIFCADGSSIKLPLVMRLVKIVRMIYRNHIPYSKRNVMVRDGYKCVYCGTNEQLTIDHVIPLSKGGKTSFDNCVAACIKCNCTKNNKTPTEAKMFLKKQPYTPTISEFFIIKMKTSGVGKFLEEIGVY